MVKYKFSLTNKFSISDFQNIIQNIYGLPDDRLFSIHDLLSNQEKFTMRAIKGIRKKDFKKLETNLVIAFAWLAAISNRLHIDLEKIVWKRFPNICSYCGRKPCVCKKNKIQKRVRILKNKLNKPQSLDLFQEMFNEIYPANERSLSGAGVHLAEEMGEVNEAIHVFMGQHKTKQFLAIQNELADWISCMFGVASSANIDIAKSISKTFSNNCHVCHKAPCVCNFSHVADYRS